MGTHSRRRDAHDVREKGRGFPGVGSVWFSLQRRWRSRVVEFGVYGLVTIYVFKSVLFQLDRNMLSVGGDSEWYMAVGHHIGNEIRQLHLTLTLHDLLVPHGLDLRLFDGLFGVFISGAWNVFLGPILAYNLTLLTAMGLNLAAARFAAAQVTTDRWALAISAIAFATAPVLLNRYPAHLSLTFIFPTALAVAIALRWLKEGSVCQPFVAAAVLVIAYFCSAYFLVASALIMAVAAGACAVRLRRAQPAGIFALVLLIALVVLGPFAVHRLGTVAAERARGFEAEKLLAFDYEYYSADLTAFAFPQGPLFRPLDVAVPWLDSTFARTVRSGEGFGFVGWPLLGGLGALSFGRDRRYSVPILLSFILLYIVTLGPAPHFFGDRIGPDQQWLPYGLADRLPLVSSLRAPGRFSLALPATLLVGVAMWTSRARVSLAHPGKCVAILVVASWLTLAGIGGLPARAPTIGAGEVRSTLLGLHKVAKPGDRIAVVPMCDGPYIGPETMVTAFVELPAIGCHAQYLNTPFFSKLSDYRDSEGLAALRCAPQVLGYAPTRFPADLALDRGALLEIRDSFKVRFLVVDLKHLSEPNCAHLRTTGLRVLKELPVLGADANWLILDLGMY